MTVVLASRFDITPEAVLAVAWRGEPVALDASALSGIAAARAAFMRYLDERPGAPVYGVNQGHGEMIEQALDEADRQCLARLKPLAAAVAFGEPYPHRVTRAMVLARLANLLGGHGMATPRLVEALVEMLNDGPIPCVPSRGQGGPGEILVLYTLFAGLSQRLELQAGERGALINGSPAAAAVLADAALSAERRIAVAEEVLALAIAAFNAPAEHYDTVLGALLGGEHDRQAFARLAVLLDGMAGCGEPRAHQAPVSYRIVPHVLAQAHAAVGFARARAAESLSAVTHNPVYLAPDEGCALGRCLGNGGFHNAVAAPAMDGIAGAWADLCLVCLRLCAGLMNGRVSGFPRFPADGARRGRDRRPRRRRLPADGDRGLPRGGARGRNADLHPGRGRERLRAGRRGRTRVSRLAQVRGGGPGARCGACRAGGRGLAGAPCPEPRAGAGTARRASDPGFAAACRRWRATGFWGPRCSASRTI